LRDEGVEVDGGVDLGCGGILLDGLELRKKPSLYLNFVDIFIFPFSDPTRQGGAKQHLLHHFRQSQTVLGYTP
jgi:hypothetical protein